MSTTSTAASSKFKADESKARVSSLGAKNRLAMNAVAGPSRPSAQGNGTGTSRVSSLGSRAGKAGAGTGAADSSLAKADSSTASINPPTTSKRTSRLFAPTASSLAKQAGNGSFTRQSGANTLDTQHHAAQSPLRLTSPAQCRTKKTTLDLDLDAFPKVPTTVPGSTSTVGENGTGNGGGSIGRSTSGRRPRISRTKVIARLAEKRELVGSGKKLVAKPNANRLSGNASRLSGNTSRLSGNARLSGPGKTRSSLGAGVNAKGGMGMRSSDVGDAVRMAKKRELRRKSEWERRRGAGENSSMGTGRGEGDMNVDT